MSHEFWSMFVWLLAASGIGFTISAGFAGWIKLSVRRFLIPYIPIAGIFLYGFIAANKIDVQPF